MRKYQDFILLILFSVGYFVAAVFWEKAIARIVVWWAHELIALRPHLSDLQALGYLAVAVVFTLYIIPHFLWFPVTLFKELLYVIKENTDCCT